MTSKRETIESLIKIANNLDYNGYHTQANQVTKIAHKISTSQSYYAKKYLQYLGQEVAKDTTSDVLGVLPEQFQESALKGLSENAPGLNIAPTLKTQDKTKLNDDRLKLKEQLKTKISELTTEKYPEILNVLEKGYVDDIYGAAWKLGAKDQKYKKLATEIYNTGLWQQDTKLKAQLRGQKVS